MSDEVPFTAHQLPVPPGLQGESGRPGLVFYGGSGSSKSTSVAQILLKQFLDTKQPPVRMLFSRKWLSALKNTLLVDCIRILQAWGLTTGSSTTKTSPSCSSGRIGSTSSASIIREKIKGAEYTHIWLEEATDFDLEDVRQLRLRLGRNKANENARYIFTFNPIDAQHWTWTDLVQVEKPGRVVRLSTYRDNIRNLSPEWIADLLALAEQDENYYRIYALGEPGILQNVIYTNYRVADYPVPYPDCVGIDFGYNNANRHHRHQTALGPLAGLGDPLPVPHDQHRPDCLAQGPRRHLVYLRRHPLSTPTAPSRTASKRSGAPGSTPARQTRASRTGSTSVRRRRWRSTAAPPT